MLAGLPSHLATKNEACKDFALTGTSCRKRAKLFIGSALSLRSFLVHEREDITSEKIENSYFPRAMTAVLHKKQTQYSLFGPQGTPYPGHPLVLAYLVMESFPSLEDALTIPRGKQVRKVFDGSGIPGSIGNIEVALEMLRLARDGRMQEAFSLASRTWSSTGSGHFENTDGARGKAQAESLVEAFEAKSSKWSKVG